jgi:hypothetical protein
MLVVQGRDDVSDSGFAGFATQGIRFFSGFLHDSCKVLQALDIDDVEKIGARVLEVWAEIVLDFVTHRLHGLVEDGLNEGHAASAPGTSFGARLDVADALTCAVFGGLDHVTFGNIVTGANLGVVGSVWC